MPERTSNGVLRMICAVLLTIVITAGGTYATVQHPVTKQDFAKLQTAVNALHAAQLVTANDVKWLRQNIEQAD